MATLNKVMLIGRLTKPPEEPRVLPNSGSTVVKFRFAVGRSKKVGDNWEKDPNQLYIDCEVFSRPDSKRNLADLVTRFCKQGDPLYIEGRLVFESGTTRTAAASGRSTSSSSTASSSSAAGRGRRR
jgi:single-stranded DNA-binding protein